MTTRPVHQILPDTPENRDKLLAAIAPHGTGLRTFPAFLIMRRGVIGWVNGPDADGAEFIIAEWNHREGLTLINRSRAEVELVARWS